MYQGRKNMLGKFYGIGVGPGAPDLLTIRAVNVLQTVDVVCIPSSSANNDSVALKAAGSYIPETTPLIEISTPMTRDLAVLEREWQTGAEKIAAILREGKDAAFISIGDAMLFSTYTYLLAKVRTILPEVRIESIPGITSFAAAAACLNMALAEGSEKLAIIPAVDDPNELRDILEQTPNVVLLKVAGKFEKIVDVLSDMGLKKSAVFVSKVGYPDQKIVYDLDSIRGCKQDYLSLILVKREGL
jgi:precorrin-2/cobalt-factor-2 C20-methyltransferase